MSTREPLRVEGSRGEDWLRGLKIDWKGGDPDPKALRPVVNQLQAESDSGCALLAASLLNVIIERLLEAAMTDLSKNERKLLFGVDRPLGSFSARIRMAHALGLLGSDDFADLNSIREIRNAFAHGLEQVGLEGWAPLTFDDKAIKGRISGLKLPRILYDHPTLTISRDTPRDRFEMAVAMCTWVLRADRLKRTQKPNPPPALSETLSDAYAAYRRGQAR